MCVSVHYACMCVCVCVCVSACVYMCVFIMEGIYVDYFWKGCSHRMQMIKGGWMEILFACKS